MTRTLKHYEEVAMENDIHETCDPCDAAPEQECCDVVGIARVAHEVNRAYCEALGDHSQPVWEDAPDWQRASAIKGVLFHMHNPDAGPEASHECWLAEKERDGWKYGPVKDPKKKEHPCFVPFKELPVEQQAKGYLFRTVVHTLHRK